MKIIRTKDRLVAKSIKEEGKKSSE